MPAGPAPTTATRSRAAGDGGPGSSSADTTRILTRRGGRAPGSGIPEARRQPVSVVVIASTTPQPDQAQAVREAVLAAIPQVHVEEGCERYALHEARDGSLVVIGQRAGPESLAAHGRGSRSASCPGNWRASSPPAPC